ncbi:hypothetical protein CBM2617_B60016 [Cupriavidus taiwanensis]|nr:hypothetical protein CBM2617_B60016 [Cupriavidus taiwanensis]SOZ88275.1 hypothetical protein CBM2618_B50019 [Cupriavidus taiwanensis]
MISKWRPFKWLLHSITCRWNSDGLTAGSVSVATIGHCPVQRLLPTSATFVSSAYGTWHLAPGTWHLAPGTWHLAPGTWHLAPGTN